MNNRVRLARLKGAKAAQRLLGVMDAKHRIASTHGQIDVLGVLAELEIYVLFRPLDGLLGAYLRGDQPGVLLSTKRPPSVQRFTAAHELGHAVLLHEPSLDSPEVIRRASNNIEGTSVPGFASRLQEIEADSFAGEFLLPAWLIAYHARIQAWSRSNLATPEAAYQLSLRCGTSYDATIRSLFRNNIISAEQAEGALRKTPKSLKSNIRIDENWSSPWSDCWVLREHDAEASAIPVTTGDLLAVQLHKDAEVIMEQHPAKPLPPNLSLLANWIRSQCVSEVGSAHNTHILRADSFGSETLTFLHRQPWELSHAMFEFSVVVKDREEGLSRANRTRMGMDAE